MPKNIFFLFILVFLSLLLAACQDSEISDVRVETATPSREIIGTEEIPLPNCGGNRDLERSLGMETTVQKGLSVSAKARGTVGQEYTLPTTAKLKLEVEIEAAYQQTYQTASSRLDSIGMTAAPGTHVVYIVEWEKQEFTSAVSFAVKGEVFQAPYTYILVVPKLSSSKQVTCPGTPEDVNFIPTPATVNSESLPMESIETGDLSQNYSCVTVNEQPAENSKIRRGKNFKVSFTVINNGNTVWPEGLTLDIASNPYNMVSAPSLPRNVPRVQPGDYIVVGPFDAKAPETDGHYVISFKIGDDFCWPYVAFDVVR